MSLVRRSTALLGAALFVTAAGCSTKKATAPAAPYVNPVKPTSNARITSQALFGDAGNKSQFDQMRRFDDGSFAFYGPYNAASVVGVLEGGGSIRWTRTPSYTAVELLPLPVNAIVPHGLIVVGFGDANHDGKTETGYASLYSSTGTLLSEITSTSSGLGRWFNRIVAVTDSEFIACGIDHPSGVERPFMQRVNLHSPGTLDYGTAVTLTGLSGYFIQMAVTSVSPTEVALAAVSRPSDDVRNLHGLRAPWPAFDPVAVEWTRGIVPPSGPWRGLRALAHSGGNLYLVGYAADNGRPVDAGGEPWSSGVAASYTATGDLRWISTINLSSYSDYIYSFAVGAGELCVAGEAASYVHSGTDEFGYGLVSKLDPNDGHLIASFTMGDENNSAGFLSGLWTGSSLICSGWTQLDQNAGPYRGWLATVDVTGTGPAVLDKGAIDPEARQSARTRAQKNPM